MAYEYVPYDGPIVDRQFARENNIPKFFNGTPCQRGHISERKTKQGDCIACVRQRGWDWYLANRERELAKAKTFYEENKQRIKEYGIEYRAVNADWIKEKKRKYGQDNKKAISIKNKERYKKNKARTLKKCQEWVKNNREKAAAGWRAAKTRRRQADGKFTSKDVLRIGENQKWLCLNCSKYIKDEYHVDHIMPLILGGSHWPSNLCLLCPSCNISKGGKHPDDWDRENGRIPEVDGWRSCRKE